MILHSLSITLNHSLIPYDFENYQMLINWKYYLINLLIIFIIMIFQELLINQQDLYNLH